MALILCSECKKEISDKAESCPGCGNPVGVAKTVNATGARTQTIEETGKKLKLHYLISSVMVGGGFFLMVLVGTTTTRNSGGEALMSMGALSFFLGIPYYVFIRFKIWWHHK